LLAQEYTAALMRVTLGSFGGGYQQKLNSENTEQGLENLKVGLKISEVCLEILKGVPTTEVS